MLSLEGINKYLKYFAFLFVVLHTIKEPWQWRWVLAFLFLSVIIVSLDAIYQYITGHDIFIHEEIHVRLGDVKRVTATYHHPNDLGLFLTALIPIFFIHALYLEVGSKKVFKVIFLCLALLSLILTFSRGAALGLLGGMAFLSFALRNYILLLLTLAGLSLSPLILPKSILEWASNVKSIWVFFFNYDRLLIFRAAFNMIKEHPFLGIGLNTFYKNYSSYKLPQDPYGSVAAHNAHLGAEVGIIGFFCLFNLMFYVILRLWKLYKRYKEEKGEVALYSIGLISAFLSFFFNCLTESGLQYSMSATFFWFLVAMAVSWAFIQDRDNLIA